MEELGLDLGGIITAVPVIGVLIAWLQATRARVKELEEDLDRAVSDYMNHLKAEKERDKLIQAELTLGRQLSNTTMHRFKSIDTQRIPSPEQIEAWQRPQMQESE